MAFCPVISATMEIRVTTESARPAGEETPAESAGGHRAAQLAGAGALTTLIAAVYSAFSLIRFAHFKTSSYDLVIFDEAVRSYAHFHPGISIIKGVHNGFGPNFSVLGDHFSPILAVLAPLYWIYDGPQTLLVAQAVLFALAIPPLWVFTRRAFGGGAKATAGAYLVSLAYGLSWPLASAVAFDFHEVAFAPVLTMVALERFQAGRLRSALIALAVLLLVKEDMGLFVAGIGVYLALARPRVVRRQWLVATGLVVVGVAYTAFATYVLIPAFGGRADYYWSYANLGQNVPQVVGHILAHPASSLRMLVAPRVKLDTILWLAAAGCFLPLLSPIVLAAVPLLAERMLNSKYPNWWVTDYQYNAYLVIVVVCAAVDGAARLDRWGTRAWRYVAGRRARSAEVPAEVRPAGAGGKPGFPATGTVALGCAIAICAVTLLTIPRFALGDALHPGFYHQTVQEKAAAAAVAVVPSGVTVEATNFLGPQLSGRDTVLLWDGEQGPLGSPWIVADVKRREFTFTSVPAEKARVALLVRAGYQIVFRRDGYLVLHRSGQHAAASRLKGVAG
jgi:uncharacterized membrane protein